jgi:beta-aspartyl-peptidase (threonine type)
MERPAPVVVVHAGAGARTRSLNENEPAWPAALLAAIGRAREIVEGGGSAYDAVRAAVRYMEDEADHFNAGRGSVLCSDGTVEMSAAVMRGADRAAGAVAGLRRTRHPIEAAALVVETDPVLLIAERAESFAAAGGIEQRDPDYFVTDRQRARLADFIAELDGATVGAVCLDGHGLLAAATSTGGIRGQIPGRVGDAPIIGAGTWADHDVAVSCTGRGEAFIRSGVARQIAAHVEYGMLLPEAARRALADVAEVGGDGGLIAVDARGVATAPFITEVMPRAMWRAGEDPVVAIGPDAGL